MLFKNVIGQAEIKQQLIDIVGQNRLGHALLFLGPEGSGSLPLAIAFANYLSFIPDPSADEKVAEKSLFGDLQELVERKLPSNVDEADQWTIKQPGF